MTPKKEFFRIFKTETGQVSWDGQMNGGQYSPLGEEEKVVLFSLLKRGMHQVFDTAQEMMIYGDVLQQDESSVDNKPIDATIDQ